MNEEKKMERITLTPEQAGELYGLDTGTLANLRCKKQGPRYFKVGRKILYRKIDLENWLFQRPIMTIDAV
jgi:hypothetical protein